MIYLLPAVVVLCLFRPQRERKRGQEETKPAEIRVRDCANRCRVRRRSPGHHSSDSRSRRSIRRRCGRPSCGGDRSHYRPERLSYQRIRPSKPSVCIRTASPTSSFEVPTRFLVGRVDGVVAERENRVALGSALSVSFRPKVFGQESISTSCLSTGTR